ncbi:MAG: hypothetical protein HND47_24065 [Chloroflexi bacterium]|nr:hypothetical protein [Chloroflexota bacterium]
MNKFALVQRFFVTVFLLLSSCGRNPDVQVIELSNNTVSYDETIHINNCGGKADSEQTASRSFATTIEGGAEFKAGYQMIVEGGISAKYSQYRNTTKSMRLLAPPGTNMEFVLRWSEEVHAGNVTVDGSTGTYEVRVPIAVEQVSSQDLGGCSGGIVPVQPTSSGEAIVLPSPTISSFVPSLQSDSPFREHKTTPIVGTGVLAQGTYSDGMAPFSESDVSGHLNIQRMRLEENPDGCGIAYFSADKVWFGSSVKTTLTINDSAVGTINQATGRHGYVFDIHINSGDKICVTYFEPSGFQVVFGEDMYYHYDSYCYRGHC